MKLEKIVVPIVIDTNILVPSLYRQSRIFSFIVQGNIVLIWNTQIYEEVAEIIVRMEPVFLKKGAVRADEVLAALDLIFDEEDMVPNMPSNWTPVLIDRDDDQFLYAAEKGGAE